MRFSVALYPRCYIAVRSYTYTGRGDRLLRNVTVSSTAMIYTGSGVFVSAAIDRLKVWTPLSVFDSQASFMLMKIHVRMEL